MIEDLQAQVSRIASVGWAAGVLDTSGEFVAYPRKDVRGGYLVRIRVRSRRSNERDFMDWVESVLGGHVRYHGTGVEWQASGVGACLDALDDVQGHLRRQARRAQMLRALCEELSDRSRPFAQRELTEEQISRRHELWVALHRARGVRL